MGIMHLPADHAGTASYVTSHSVILAVGVLVTGSIWARASWGHWFVWDEPMLVSFLIVFLLYATYWPLRFSIEDKERQSRYASVFAIVAGAFVPLNFAAVRMAEQFTHPQTGATDDGAPARELTFVARPAWSAVRHAVQVRDGLKHATFRLRPPCVPPRRERRAVVTGKRAPTLTCRRSRSRGRKISLRLSRVRRVLLI